MAQYVSRRLGLLVVSVLGVTLISFLIAHAVPSDPIVSNLGQQASQRPEIVKAFKEKWGLDKPLYIQYLTFLENLTRGELGNSINTRRAITKDIKAFLPATIELSTFAVFMAIVIGVPLGVAAAVWRETVIDHVARLISLIGVSIPTFWFATVSLVLFYATLHWTVGPSRLGPQIPAPPFVTGFYTIDSLLPEAVETFPDALQCRLLPDDLLNSHQLGFHTRLRKD